MHKIFLFVLPFLFLQGVEASSYSQCKILGVIEDTYFNKVHLGVLKVDGLTHENYDAGYQTCKPLVGKTIALYDDPKDAADEPCQLVVSTEFKTQKFRHKMKDNFQRGDMVRFDYTYYEAMGPNGGLCVKDWRLIEHVPIKPHAR